MGKATSRFLFVASCILIQVVNAYAFNAGPDPSLAAWWKLDEGAGTKVNDSSGNNNTGTISGSPQWVVGNIGGALSFNANGYVDCGNSPSLNPTDQITICLWIKSPGFGANAWGVFVAKGDTGGSYRFGRNNTGNACHFGLAGTYYDGTVVVADNTWHHVAATYNGALMQIWVDAVPDTSLAHTGQIASSTTKCYVGENADAAGRTVVAVFDDVRIYSRALTVDELKIVAKGYLGTIATNPIPADKATDVAREVVLGWTPGPLVGTHDVYLGTSLNDVNNASSNSALCVAKGQDANSYDPPGRLAFGTTYYWRVDEVNKTADHFAFKGDVWSFTTEPLYYKVTGITATASSSTTAGVPANTINGSGLDANDLHSADGTAMWVTAKGTTLPAWIQYDLGRLRKLETMLVWNYNGLFEDSIGIGAKDVTVEYSADAVSWTPLSGVPQFTWAPGADGYAADTIVDFGGMPARYVKLTITSHWGTGSNKQTGLSEVRFLEMLDYARTPSPADKATGVSPSVTFSWRSGREAASANIYVGTDPNALPLSGASATNNFAPANLSVGTTYSWRVDEVNNATTPSTWAGDVWSFTTPDFIAVDDVESYNDTTNKLYEVWIDGYGTGTNGAVVGYNDSGSTGTFGDTVTFHGGKQSMPFAYGTGGVTLSEATRTFASTQDWTLHGVKTLVLYFYGSPTNTVSQLYVKINNTKVNYTGDAGSISRHRWNQWNIDLASVAGGVNAVKSLTIGLTGSGKGSLFFDDILLYKDAPVIATPTDPGTTGLVGYYAFNSNVNDSSSAGNNGTVVGTPTYVAGLSATNMAIKLNGTTDCVDLGKKAVFNPTGSFSVSLWANIGAWSTAWGQVMVSNRGETDVGGWQIRRGASTGLCWTTRGIGGTDDLTGATPAQNEWIHVTCVFDQAAATKTLYINGLVSISGATTANAKITATTTDTYIGARATADNTSRDTFFTGMLDEVRIFNRALTAGEADFLSKPTP